MNAPENRDLPNPFIFEDESEVRSEADWPRRRRELLKLVVDLEYGGLPPAPAATRYEHLHSTRVKSLGGARYASVRVVAETDPPFSFLLYLLVPAGDGPFPVVLNGDGCWRYVTDSVAEEVVRRGYILAQFNRVEIVPDNYTSERSTGLYPVYPNADFGALSAWAWGYHRCVDVLGQLEEVDADRIAVVGHSRGGKTSLLAGATDTRIALTSANDSGAGGAGSYHFQAEGSETLADGMRAVPYWYGPRMREYAGRQEELPFDQHFLKAAVAPRPLLTTEALGDLWANPRGTWQTHLGAKQVFRFLHAEDRIGIVYRQGDHYHSLADWEGFLDFADWQLRGEKPSRDFETNPFPELPPCFSWSAPGCIH